MDATPDPRSGGKMIRPRRSALSRTPYDRPTPRLLPNSSPASPNWLSKLILSPTRMIATGAGKVLASVFAPESSSSSSSSEEDSVSEDDMDDVSNDASVSSHGANGLEKTPEIVNSLGKDSQALQWRSDTKRVIEQLLMRETFSREECDRLTHIIKSRVVDSVVSGSKAFERQNVDKPDIHSEAVIEAQKWILEKKLGSNSMSGRECGTCNSNADMLPHVNVSNNEEGSPVDLAKSYMRSRPPWTSPSWCKYDSPTGVQLFNDSTSYILGGKSGSYSKLTRDSHASGSWNILEEIRSKVRSKATEELLKSHPSSRIDWSTSASDYKRHLHLLSEDKVDAGMEDDINNSEQLVDAPLIMASHATSNDLPVSQIAQDHGLQNDAVLSNPATLNPQQNEDLRPDLIVEEIEDGKSKLGQTPQPSEDMQAISERAAIAANGPKNTDVNIQPLSSIEGEYNQDPRLNEISCSTSKEVAGRDETVPANGFPSPGSRLYDEGLKPFGSNGEKTTKNDFGEENCKLLSEASVDVPIMYVNDSEEQYLDEINSVASGSQISSSMQHEQFLLALPQQKSKRSNPAKRTEKQQERKVSRSNRRGRGRGK
ncbi:hypothetical protein K2173_000329 [Erythroxylum novogranatense]|uniref:Protein KAKU4 n=1 Tax=Erythroxylum novogranatense TaxID=1862640 RepID=A0AAV8SW96_9ROSI|nr:hypothetical protein K2173_000329 [Erythroxylum novogranatense]